MSTEIRDSAIILGTRKYNENSLIVKILSKNHGIFSGFVKSALSNKDRNNYQIANLVDFTWKARDLESLGFLKIEMIKSYLGKIIFNNLKINCIKAIFKIIEDNVFEREPHQDLYIKLLDFLDQIGEENEIKILGNYVKLELNLLQILGYGIDLSHCALTGKKTGLYFVSPKSGRAACKDAAIEYQDKLLILPNFLTQEIEDPEISQILLGLKLTGFFLENNLENKDQEFFFIRNSIQKRAKEIENQANQISD